MKIGDSENWNLKIFKTLNLRCMPVMDQEWDQAEQSFDDPNRHLRL